MQTQFELRRFDCFGFVNYIGRIRPNVLRLRMKYTVNVTPVPCRNLETNKVHGLSTSLV